MSKLTIKTGTEEDFFKRGRRLAKMADLGERLPEERILSFEDPADVMKLITATRLALFRTVKETPGSITEAATMAMIATNDPMSMPPYPMKRL